MTRAPAVFIGHGSPMSAIETSATTQAWAKLAQQFPKPRAIVVVSAHWTSHGVRVTSSQRPGTIHDFGGFPRALYEMQYPAPGEPALAQRVKDLLSPYQAQLDPHRGLDHGVWCVLTRMYSEADIPVIQVSLDANREPKEHFAMAQKLSALRDDNILLMASGNIVHNLRAYFLIGKMTAWVRSFDNYIKQAVEKGDDEALMNYQKHPDAAEAAPDWEHYFPVLYGAAWRLPDERPAVKELEFIPGLSMTMFGYGVSM